MLGPKGCNGEEAETITTLTGYFSSVAQSCPTLCDPMNCNTSIINSHSLLKLMSIRLVIPSNHLILCHPFSSCLQPFQATGLFLMSWLFTSGGQKYWSFRFRISPLNEYSGLISFRIDWLDLLAVQGTLKSLLQHHISSVLSFLYGPTLTSIHT